jgi:hypothetical protein
VHIAKQGQQQVKQQLPASMGGSLHLNAQHPSPWWNVPPLAVSGAGVVTVVLVTVFDGVPLILLVVSYGVYQHCDDEKNDKYETAMHEKHQYF